MHIVSLLPSATEILCAIGGRDLLVGRSHECDHPAGLEPLPALTAQLTAFDPSRGVGAAEIDRQVASMRAGGQPLYALDTGLLEELAPDLILTQDLCDVCSIDLETVRAAATAMPSPPEVLSLNPETVEGVLDDVLRIGEAAGLATGLAAAARDLVVELRGRLFRAQEHVNQFLEGPVVGFMEWTEPIFVAGHWTVQLIERAGGRHPLNPGVPKPTSGAAAGPMQAERIAGKSVRVSIEDFVAARPEVLIIAPCGLDLEQTAAEAERLSAEPWFCALPAVEAGRVALVDGSAMFNRPGPRLIDAMEFLAGYIGGRPELIPAGFPWQEYRA